MSEPSDDLLRQWLLRRLSSEQAQPLEQRLLTDAAFGERLREAETDLLDDLARGRLDAAERTVAEALFAAHPRQRERLRIARALAQAAARSAPRVRVHRYRRWLAGGAAVAAALAIAVIGLQPRIVETPPAADVAAVTVTLLASTQRSAGGVEDVRIAPAAKTVRLQAEIETDAAGARYGLEIRDGERTAFRSADLPALTAGAYRYVEANVPAQAFGAGSVEVRLVAGGAQPVRIWTLRIRRD